MVGLCQQDSNEGFAVEASAGFNFHVDSPCVVRPVMPDHHIAAEDLASSLFNERLDLWQEVSGRFGLFSGLGDRHALI